MAQVKEQDFPFFDKLYIGRIKVGNQGFNDDVVGALLHDGRGGLSHSGLNKIAKEEGYQLWGTDPMCAQGPGRKGVLSKSEFDKKMVLLNNKLMGNPTVISDRLVTFLDLAVLMVDNNIFVKENTKQFVKVAKEEYEKKIEADKKVRVDQVVVKSESVKTAFMGAKVEQAKVKKVGEERRCEEDEDVILVDQEEYMDFIVAPKVEKEVEVSTSMEGKPKKIKKTKKTSSQKETIDNCSLLPSVPPKGPNAELWHGKMAEIDKIIMDEFKISQAKHVPSEALKMTRELLIAAGASNIKLMAENDHLKKQLAEEKKCGVAELTSPLLAKLDLLPQALDKAVCKSLLGKIEYLVDMVENTMGPKGGQEEEMQENVVGEEGFEEEAKKKKEVVGNEVGGERTKGGNVVDKKVDEVKEDGQGGDKQEKENNVRPEEVDKFEMEEQRCQEDRVKEEQREQDQRNKIEEKMREELVKKELKRKEETEKRQERKRREEQKMEEHSRREERRRKEEEREEKKREEQKREEQKREEQKREEQRKRDELENLRKREEQKKKENLMKEELRVKEELKKEDLRKKEELQKKEELKRKKDLKKEKLKEKEEMRKKEELEKKQERKWDDHEWDLGREEEQKRQEMKRDEERRQERVVTKQDGRGIKVLVNQTTKTRKSPSQSLVTYPLFPSVY